ncbi:TPA: LuxR C-terminal-related transcriptional regulator [Serratia marcescens]
MNMFINIAFLDNDSFFVAGARCALSDYFDERGIKARFTGHVGAELIFLAVSKGNTGRFCHRFCEPHGIYFSVCDLKEADRCSFAGCSREAGKVYRNEGVEKLLQTVNRAMRRKKRCVYRAGCCSWCQPLQLTPQEKTVMQYLRWEMTPTTIARCLKVSIKTVSTHKRAVMKKMHFQRDAELYHWLRLGDFNRGDNGNSVI